jgi:hypothetical protein
MLEASAGMSLMWCQPSASHRDIRCDVPSFFVFEPVTTDRWSCTGHVESSCRPLQSQQHDWVRLDDMHKRCSHAAFVKAKTSCPRPKLRPCLRSGRTREAAVMVAVLKVHATFVKATTSCLRPKLRPCLRSGQTRDAAVMVTF